MPTTRTTDRSPPPPRQREKQRREGKKCRARACGRPSSPTLPSALCAAAATSSMAAAARSAAASGGAHGDAAWLGSASSLGVHAWTQVVQMCAACRCDGVVLQEQQRSGEHQELQKKNQVASCGSVRRRTAAAAAAGGRR